MRDEGKARWWQRNKRREERAQVKEEKAAKADRTMAEWLSSIAHIPKAVVYCPRCGRDVVDSERGRQAHGVSCVRIPQHRSKAWGVKTRIRR